MPVGEEGHPVQLNPGGGSELQVPRHGGGTVCSVKKISRKRIWTESLWLRPPWWDSAKDFRLRGEKKRDVTLEKAQTHQTSWHVILVYYTKCSRIKLGNPKCNALQGYYVVYCCVRVFWNLKVDISSLIWWWLMNLKMHKLPDCHTLQDTRIYSMTLLPLHITLYISLNSLQDTCI